MENKKIIIITVVLFLLAGTGTFVFASNQGNFNEEDIDYRQDKEPTYNKVENNNNNSSNNSNNSNEGNTTPIPNPGITEDPILPDNNGTNSSTNTTRPGNTNTSSINSSNKPNNGTSTNKPNNSGTTNNPGISESGNNGSNANKPSEEETTKPAEPETPVVKDTTPPALKIKYNTTDATKGPVIVTITSNEPIKALADWSLSNDKLSLTKAFSDNTSGSVTIYDEANNASSIDYNIQNIDNIAPKATVESSNNNGNKLTFRDITVTITADKDIKPVVGWDLKDNRILTKTFSNVANKEYSVKIYDLVGNETEVKYEIKNYDPTSPEVIVNKDENETTITMVYKEPLDDTWIQNENGEYTKVENIPSNSDETIVITMPDGTIKVFESAANITVKVSNENPDGTTNKTNQPVKVEISSNKELETLEGWTLSEDKRTLSRFESEIQIDVTTTVYDLNGNSTTIVYSILNVDTIPPRIKTTASAIKSKKLSNGKIQVTIQADISKIMNSDWKNKLSGVFTKEYTEEELENGVVETIIMKDSFDNIGTEVVTMSYINGIFKASHEFQE